MLRRRRDSLPSLLHQLHRMLVYAQHRALRVVRALVGLKHLLHAGGELPVLVGRNHPILQLAPGDAVFLSVFRSVS